MRTLGILMVAAAIAGCSGGGSNDSSSSGSGSGSTTATTHFVPSSSTGGSGTGSSGSTSGSSGSSASSSASSSSGGSTGTACIITITGAYTDTLHCNEPVGGSYDPNNGRGAVPIQSIEQVSGAPKASFALDALGDLQTTTYDYTSGNIQNLGSAYLGDITHGFTASYGNSEGTVTMTLTELTVTGQLADGGKTYDVHGSADATLVGHGNATGEQVTAHIDF